LKRSNILDTSQKLIEDNSDGYEESNKQESINDLENKLSEEYILKNFNKLCTISEGCDISRYIVNT